MVVIVVVVMVMIGNNLVMFIVVTVAVTLPLALAMGPDVTWTHVDMLRERPDRGQVRGQGCDGGLGEKTSLHLGTPSHIVMAAAHTISKPIRDCSSV